MKHGNESQSSFYNEANLLSPESSLNKLGEDPLQLSSHVKSKLLGPAVKEEC